MDQQVNSTQLIETKEEAIKRWEASGLLEGLTGLITDGSMDMYKCCPESYIIDENNE
jgi:hypothetical protein